MDGNEKSEKNENHSFKKSIFKLLMIIPSLLNILTRILSLVDNEAADVKKHFFALVLVCLFIGCLFLSVWWSLLGILGIYLMVTLKLGYVIVLFIIFMLNSLLLTIAILFFVKEKNKPLFLETKSILSLFRNC